MNSKFNYKTHKDLPAVAGVCSLTDAMRGRLKTRLRSASPFQNE